MYIDNEETAYILANLICKVCTKGIRGVQWLRGSMLDLRQRDRGFDPHRRYCVVSLSKNINPSLVLVEPRKTCPFINEDPFISERLLMGRKETNQTNKRNRK